jgi:dephospho-CoA kinase
VIGRGSPAFDAIVAEFGKEILAEDGEIDRAALGSIVFAERARLQELEAITHPAVGRRIDQLIRAAAAKVVVIEAIKLLEGRWADVADAVWVVDCAPEMQLRRLVEGRGLPESVARQRMAAQNKQADKLRRADVIIGNDGSVDEARAQVARHWQNLVTD